MSSRRLIQYLTAAILLLLGVIGYAVYLIFSQSPPARPEVRIITNTLNQIAVRKVNSTNLLGTLGRVNWASIESTN